MWRCGDVGCSGRRHGTVGRYSEPDVAPTRRSAAAAYGKWHVSEHELVRAGEATERRSVCHALLSSESIQYPEYHLPAPARSGGWIPRDLCPVNSFASHSTPPHKHDHAHCACTHMCARTHTPTAYLTRISVEVSSGWNTTFPGPLPTLVHTTHTHTARTQAHATYARTHARTDAHEPLGASQIAHWSRCLSHRHVAVDVVVKKKPHEDVRGQNSSASSDHDDFEREKVICVGPWQRSCQWVSEPFRPLAGRGFVFARTCGRLESMCAMPCRQRIAARRAERARPARSLSPQRSLARSSRGSKSSRERPPLQRQMTSRSRRSTAREARSRASRGRVKA